MEYLKKASKHAEENSSEARRIVEELLADIRVRGEQAVREIARKFDHWEGDFILSPEKKKRLIASVPQQVKDDVDFACQQVAGFARMQRESIRDFSVQTLPGVRLGQKIIPMSTAGCYVPGGRFAHTCSAIMSVATAKAAGVPFVIAATPPRGDSIDPSVCYALDLAGADVILEMGGVQAVASMAYGLFTGRKTDIVVGPGNAFVAEAKAILAGEGACGIDLYAGPSEVAVIADETADPVTVAIDLLSQAEHGANSPAWLFTTSRELGGKVLAIMPGLINDLPNPQVAALAWADYGEVILCADREEVLRVSDAYASEHLEVQAADSEWWLQHLGSYGSLFLGEGSTVAHGDKCSGTNHILPTKKSAHYSGGLNVHKFLKICTYQEISPAANKIISGAASRLSRVEGMEAHARACDWRLRKYFPQDSWDFEVYRHPRS